MEYESCWRYTMLHNLRTVLIIFVTLNSSTKLNKPVQLSNVPPTRAAAHQHISRVYYQVQTWLGSHLEPQEKGLILRNEFLEPIIILPPVPEELLKTIYCNCKNSWGQRCGYEDCTSDPKILQDLETNIIDDENN
ncbi:uncharacterized protein TNIN_66811 [Trichonephila inaurata madagascariensis]|uniref:Uncharacterized protein n=1 Tax=Trichonephila inaurata madagascariensis TaxID=2747483 RepID=A0A8X6X0X8_9ARAC|nr:uncharacterized protein TNIN_66811 [Trichonephila inaurata madagascariensis]